MDSVFMEYFATRLGEAGVHVLRFEFLITIIAIVGSCVWIRRIFLIWRHFDEFPSIATLSPCMEGDAWPSVAIVIPARDEAGQIVAAVRSHLRTDYPNVTLVAVNDRSSDETGPLLDQLAAEDDRLRVVHVEELPVGWLGKTHAMEIGARATNSEWLLFTDGDVLFQPEVLRKTVSLAVRTKSEHVVATPTLVIDSILEAIASFGFLASLAEYAPYWKVQDPKSWVYMGVGAFNLVRRDAFDSIGGFGHLRLSVDDDMRLGQALKWHGHRSMVVIGDRQISVKWQDGAVGIIKGLEKNSFAALEFNLSVTLILIALGWIWAAGPWVGVLFGTGWTRIIGLTGLAATVAVGLEERRNAPMPFWVPLTMPLGYGIINIALLNSVRATCYHRGIVWRDHFYPLQLLKAHVSERRRWLRNAWRASRESP